MALSGTTTFNRIASFNAPEGGNRVTVTQITPGAASTYTASGEPLTPAQLGLSRLEAVSATSTGYNVAVDVGANGGTALLRLFVPATTPGPAVKMVEYTGATAIATTDVINILAIGV